jgi:hypothetical protein
VTACSSLRRQIAVGRCGEKQQQVNVRGWIELATPVATDREQGQRRRQLQRSPQVAENFVDQTATLVQQARRIAAGQITLADRRLALLQM